MSEDISHQKGQKPLKKGGDRTTLPSRKMSTNNHTYSTHKNKRCHHSANLHQVKQGVSTRRQRDASFLLIPLLLGIVTIFALGSVEARLFILVR